jgi:hypothetical protein
MSGEAAQRRSSHATAPVAAMAAVMGISPQNPDPELLDHGGTSIPTKGPANLRTCDNLAS